MRERDNWIAQNDPTRSLYDYTDWDARLANDAAQLEAAERASAPALAEFDRETFEAITLGPRLGAEAAAGDLVLDAAAQGYRALRAARVAGDALTPVEIAASKVIWVDENAAMSAAARAFNDSAAGARSNALTQSGQAPAITRTLNDGTTAMVRFDGLDEGVLVDRKLSVVTTNKAKDQALRQSQALEQNALTARWEVSNAQQAVRAENMLKQLGIKNITVRTIENGK